MPVERLRAVGAWLLVYAALCLLGVGVAAQPAMATAAVGGILIVGTATALIARDQLAGVLFIFLLLAPVVPTNVGGGGFTLQRLLLLFFASALLIGTRTTRDNRWRLRYLRVALILFSVFISIGILGVVVSPLPATAIGGVGYYLLYVAVPLLVGVLAVDSHAIRELARPVALAALAVAGVALLQYADPGGPWSHLPGSGLVDLSGEGPRALSIRASGTLGHPVALGTYAVMTLPFLLRAAIEVRTRSRSLIIAALLALVVCIMLSQTRMAMLALVPGLLPWLLISTRRRSIAAMSVVAALTLVVVVGPAALQRQVAVLGTTLSYRGQAGSSDVSLNSVAARTSIYTTGYRIVRQHPVLGVGLRLPTRRFDADIFQRAGSVYAFESYLVVLFVESGLLGAIAFASFVLSLGFAAYRFIQDRNTRVAVLSALLIGAALAIGSNGFDAVVAYYWLLIGVLFGTGLSHPRFGASGSAEVVA